MSIVLRRPEGQPQPARDSLVLSVSESLFDLYEDVKPADLNGDGLIDLVAANSAEPDDLVILLQTTKGQFEVPHLRPSLD